MKIFQNNIFKTASALILTLGVVSIFLIPKPVKAIPVEVTAGHVFTTRISQFPTDPDFFLNHIMKPLVRILVQQLLQATTNQIVGWIQGNNGRNVGYVKNPQQFFKN